MPLLWAPQLRASAITNNPKPAANVENDLFKMDMTGSGKPSDRDFKVTAVTADVLPNGNLIYNARPRQPALHE